jgi:hypothetical protein
MLSPALPGCLLAVFLLIFFAKYLSFFQYVGRNVDKNHHETFDYQGVKFLIHNPYELFSKQSASHTTVANSSMIVYLNPQKTIIDEVLQKYNPKRFEMNLKRIDDSSFFVSRRGCYLEKEKPLKFFKKYMRNNCKSECLANRTVAVCGCAQFFMVREPSTRICGVNDMKCYKEVEKQLQNQDECDCLLECGEIEYWTDQKLKEFFRFAVID